MRSRFLLRGATTYVAIYKSLTMLRRQETLRKFFFSRSISFRLYVVIIPTTVISILLVTYIEGHIVTAMLEREVWDNTQTVASQLAADLSSSNAPVTPEGMHSWLVELVETNAFITRIEVDRLIDGSLSRVDTTSSSTAPPVLIDETTVVQQGKPAAFPQYHDRERALKVIVPIRPTGSAIQGCVSVTGSFYQADLVSGMRHRTDLVLIPASVLVLVLLLHFLFTRGLIGRIGRLQAAIIGARSRSMAGMQAPVEHSDELGVIAQQFNETMAEIKRASHERDRLLEEQKNFNVQLQARVSEATKELSLANQQLSQVNQDLIDTQRRLTKVERMAVAGQMAAAFAHEVGSPLSAISTHLQLMAEEKSCNEETQRRIRLIQEQVNRITGFVEEMLSETRAAAHAHGRVRVNDILKQLLMFLGQHLDYHKIHLESSFEPALPEIEANAQQLQQVFLNLLNNAADAMPDGGTVRVETRTEQEGQNRSLVAVSIADSGVGISEDERQRLFEPFFSTKELGRGTGLGLSIAARIVRQHEGTISLESEPGRGTTFTIRFPSMPPGNEVPREGISL
jgi:two-component system, NtrC family, sensor kinase